MIGSIIFYFAICFLLLFFATRIEKKNNIRFFMLMLILTLTLVSGLRHQTVGIDTSGYVGLISRLRDGYFLKLNNISEQGFISLSYLLVNVSSGYTFALLIYSLITNTLIILRLYDYKNTASFTWSVFIYYMVFYFATFNTIRQWIAMALIFFGTRYIGKSIIKFLIFVVLAVLMHASAIFALFYIPLYYFSLNANSRKVTIRKFAMIIFAIAAGAFVYITMANKYSSYLASSLYGDVSWVNIFLILFMCFIILYDNNGKIVIRMNTCTAGGNETKGIKYESLAFFVGIVLTLMVFFARYADRIGQYFLLFELVFFSHYIKKEKTRAITIVFVLALCLYLRIFSFVSSGYGEIPYIPFWS